MNFFEQPPSQRWAALNYRGEKFAEVWFKPEGEPYALTFRIPQESFQLPGMDQLLTAENLLTAVAVAAEDVASWEHAGVRHSCTDGPGSELSQALPTPPPDVGYLEVRFALKPPTPADAAAEIGEPQTGEAESGESQNGEPRGLTRLQDLEARWSVIVGLESAIEQLRLRVESALGEMEAASQQMLTANEKVDASNLDVLNWNKAKGRARYAQPKAKEFVHRATWALGTPERKKLAELFKNGLGPDTPQSRIEELPEELARMLKQHQILSAQGNTVYLECKTISGEIQGTLRTLLNNAAANAQKKRVVAHKKGKYV